MPPAKLHTSTSLDIYSALTDTELSIPVASEGISAGFPSPASDFVDVAIAEKPSFKYSLDKRCLILADRFFEWQWLDPKGPNNRS
jgi:hypothetical protein